MLAQIEPTRNDFMALASYLVHGKERPTSPDRVAWAFTHNIPTADPELAADIMAATARQSRRCTQPTYHLSINWHPDERPSPEVMQQIARKTLGLAGLAEHQALVMRHGDKPHRHLHMMINRVHPDSGKAWSTSHDYKKFDRIMKQLADQHGFQYVLAHAFNPELTDDLPKQPNSNATYASKRGAPTNRPQWPNADARALGERLSEGLDQASGREDVEAALEKDGLALEAKGHGLVVGTPASYAKFSRLGLTTSAKAFAQRFGQSYAEYETRSFQSSPHRFSPAEREALSERLFPVFANAVSWSQLSLELDGIGLELQSRGKNLVITDGQRRMQIAGIDPLLLTTDLTQRMGMAWADHLASVSGLPPVASSAKPTVRRSTFRTPSHRPQPSAANPNTRAAVPAEKTRTHHRHPWEVDAIDIARAIGTKEQLKQAINKARGQRKARIAAGPLMRQIEEELKEAMKENTSLKPPKPRPRTRTPPRKPPRPPRSGR